MTTTNGPVAPAPLGRPDDRPPTSDPLAAVLESASIAVIATDPDWLVRSWNRAAEELFGYSAGEMIGRPVLELVPRDRRDETRALLERVRAGERVPPFVADRLRRDGATVQVAVSAWPVRDPVGGFLGTGIAYTDRTDQARAEEEARRLRADLERRLADLTRTTEELRVSEERVRLVMESVQDYAILMLHPDGRVASWSPGAERLKGYRADEVVGRHFSLFYPPEAVARGWPEKELAAAAATGRLEDEGWRVRKDGSRFWANVIITAIRDGAGRLVGFGKVSRDLTARKHAEDEVRRLNAELDGRVRERTAELEAVNRDLAQRNAENEMFVYSVSHDLRSPLVNLQGFSRELEKASRGLAELLGDGTVPEAVKRRGQEVLDGKVAKSVGFIRAAVTRLSNIIDALLRLSRAGRVDYRWETVDVAQVVTQVVQAAQQTITERGATVRVGPLAPAWGDRTAVEQVFANLVGNALTYLDPARPGVIEIGQLPDEGTGGSTYFVRDNGLGMAEGHRQKIFQAFQRAHPGVGSGEGLGLAIVARVVERHRGRVWVESRPGEGSTFFVALTAPPAARGPRGEK
ncbi:MAG: PAS domain S-box protein [Planctomycetes bacterium]|nr:PAS domain S-box protein [Planctomycetota bacterium]